MQSAMAKREKSPSSVNGKSIPKPLFSVGAAAPFARAAAPASCDTPNQLTPNYNAAIKKVSESFGNTHRQAALAEGARFELAVH
jgi:hypothetical protein